MRDIGIIVTSQFKFVFMFHEFFEGIVTFEHLTQDCSLQIELYWFMLTDPRLWSFLLKEPDFSYILYYDRRATLQLDSNISSSIPLFKCKHLEKWSIEEADSNTYVPYSYTSWGQITYVSDISRSLHFSEGIHVWISWFLSANFFKMMQNYFYYFFFSFCVLGNIHIYGLLKRLHSS